MLTGWKASCEWTSECLAAVAHLASLGLKSAGPAINWLTSYSLYTDSMGKWFDDNVSDQWMGYRQRLMGLLQDEAELEEIVKMVGMDALSAEDRLKMEAARSIREDFLHQNSFHEVDTYTSLRKQFLMMELVIGFYDYSLEALKEGASIQKLISMAVREKIGRFKYTLDENIDAEYDRISKELHTEIANVLGKEE